MQVGKRTSSIVNAVDDEVSRRVSELWLLIQNPQNLHKDSDEWRTILRCEALLDGVHILFDGEPRPFFVYPSVEVNQNF